MGLFFAAAQMGGIAGPAGMGMIADATGDFRLSLSVVAVFCALGCLLAPLARQGGEIYPNAASGSLPYRD
jgi:MFS-type transporter involved in bile tolerance (Atg22 family)